MEDDDLVDIRVFAEESLRPGVGCAADPVAID
jgi:hypothetical protein